MPASSNSSINSTISAIVALARGSKSGRPSPRRSVSAMYASIMSRASSSLPTPAVCAAA
jgi:hypothetical protein